MKILTSKPMLADPTTQPRTAAPTEKSPLFLPIKAPQPIGEHNCHRLIFMTKFVEYGVHWNLPNGQARAMCHGEGCARCQSGHKPQMLYAAVALDRDAVRYLLAQVSYALLERIVEAADEYELTISRHFSVVGIDACDPTDPWQPLFNIEAWRTAAGPRYEVTAEPVRWIPGGPQISYDTWRQTPEGKQFSSCAESQTALPLRRHAPHFVAFDPLPLIFPAAFRAPQLEDFDDVD